MIEDHILKVRERISLACTKIGQDSGRIVIVAVSKTRTPEEIKEAIAAGIIDIGESRVQEAVSKYEQLSVFISGLPSIRCHMVGHLQTNKVREAVRVFDLIHSVDSLHLGTEIDKQAAKINKIQDILLEIKTSPESTKFGIKPDDIEALLKELAGLKNVSVKGLMTIAPVLDNPEGARPYFKLLREAKDRANRLGFIREKLQILSMGMSDDFQIAVEEGSNMLRIGRAIFGA